MKKRIAEDELDVLLYKYMPRAEEKWIAVFEKKAAEERYVPSEQFREKVRSLTERANRMEKRQKMIKFLKQAAAVFLIMVSVSFAACMSVEATREKIIEFIRKIHADWTEYKYDLKAGTVAEFVLIEPEYLPEGYREYDREDFDDWINVCYREKKTQERGEIEYISCLAEGLTVGLDTEGARIKEKEIGGEKVEYFENDGIAYVYWTDENTYYSFSGYIKVDELLKMADSIINNIKYKEK